MSRLLMILLLSTFVESTDAQIIFNIYGRSDCSSNVVKMMHFGLEKDGELFLVENEDGTLVLKDTGSYQLKYVIVDFDASQLGRVYQVTENDTHVKDTISIYAIHKCSEPTTYPEFVVFCCCENKCNGKFTDYYSNGNKRLEGCFIEGKPVGKLKYYNSNGDHIKTEKFNKEGKLKRIKKYYP